MNAPQTLIAFPNYIADLGGPITVRIGVRFAWVQLKDKTIRLPAREIAQCGNDGLSIAETARKYAYRNL